MNNIIPAVFFCFFLPLSSAPGQGAAPGKAEFRCRLTTAPPALDGRDLEEAWKKTDWAAGFLSFADGVTAAETQSEVKMAHDATNLYIFCRGYRGKPAVFKIGARDGPVWADDSFEFIIRPKGLGDDYFQLNINGRGTVYDSANHFVEEEFAQVKSVVTREAAWDSGARVVARADERGWSAEIAIPLKAFNAAAPVPGDQWGLNVLRYTGDLEETSVWGKVPFEGWHSSGAFVPITMAADSLATGRKISFHAPASGVIAGWELSDLGQMAGTGLSGSQKGVLGKSSCGLKNIGGKSYVVTAGITTRDKGMGRLIVTYEDTLKRQWKIYLFERARAPAPNTRMDDLLYFPADAERITALVVEKTNTEGEFGLRDVKLTERGLRFDHYIKALDPTSPKKTYPLEDNEAFMFLPLNRLAISSRRPLPAFFQLRASYKLLARKDLDFKLIFDLPEGVRIARLGIPAHPSGTDGFPDPEALWKAVERPEGKYRRYTVSRGPAWFPRYSDNRTPLLLLAATSWKSGTKGKLFYWLEWNGGRQAEREAMLEAIDIPAPARLCRKFKTGISIMPQISPGLDAVKVWPEMGADLKFFGINTVDLFNLTPENYLEEKRAIAAMLRKAGINVAIGVLFPEDTYVIAVRREKRPAMLGLDLDGNVQLRKGIPVPCPSYRGAEYRRNMDRLRDIVAQFEADQLLFDEEFFKMGNKICYCDRCLAGFEQWFKINHPGTTYVSPKKFMRERDKYPDLARAWVRYKSRLVADGWAGEARKTAQAALQSKGIDKKIFIAWTGGHLQGPVLENNFHDAQYLLESGIVDAFLPMPYYYFSYLRGSVAAAADYIAFGQNKFFPDKPPINLPYVSTGDNGAGQYFEPQSGIRDQIFEMALSQAAQGVVHFFFHVMDGYQFKAMAEGFNAVAKAEDIILAGEKVAAISADHPGLRLRAIKSGDALVLLASEYSYKQIDAKITLKGCAGWRVRDLMTDEQIAETDENGSFSLRLKDVRAMLLKLEK